MTVDRLYRIFKERPGVTLTDSLSLFKQHGRYIVIEDDGEQSFKKLNDALQYLDKSGKAISEYVEAAESFPVPTLSGGRGSKSGGGGRKKAFGHARGGGDGFSGKGHASEFNTGRKNQTEADMAAKFTQKYVGSNIEHGITVNERGDVTRHIHGDATSVAIWGDKGEMVYHNHPHGGSFSDSDLLAAAQTSARGVAAVAREGTYYFVKGKKFNAPSFFKAVKNATVPSSMSYDDGVAHWLNKNAKKFGYSYTFVKAKA